MLKTTTVLFVLLLLICCLRSVAQTRNAVSGSRHVVKTINIEDGLLNNAVTDIVTDAAGFTWVSAKTGLQRYNGYKLETIDTIADIPKLVINYPVYFLKLQNNALLITHRQGVLLYNPYLNKFSQLITVAERSGLNTPVRPLQQTKEGAWCLQNEVGFVLYNYQGKVITTVPVNDSVLQFQVSSPDFKYACNNQYIYILASHNRLLVFNKNSRLYSFIAYNKQPPHDIACTQTAVFLLQDDGICAMHINTSGNAQFYTLTNYIGNASFEGAINLINANQLLVSINRHLLQFDSNCQHQQEITTLNNNTIINTGFILKIYADQFRRIWLMTNDDIKLVQNCSIPFQNYAYANANNFIRSIYIDEERHFIIAGCFNGGLQLYDTLGNALWKQPLITAAVKDIIAVEKINNDAYLVETLGNGWYVLHVSKKFFSPLPVTDAMEKQLHTHSITYSNNSQRISDSTIIICNPTDVVACAFTNNNLKKTTLLFHNNNTAAISCFYYTTAKALWVGTTAGTLYCQVKNAVVYTISTPGNYIIRCITEDAANNIWAGTDKGLFVYNKNGHLIKSFTTQSGLLNDCIYALLAGSKTPAVYASSNFGLSFVSLNGTIKNYTKEAGLQENEFNTEAAATSGTGKFFFGGINGISAFYPSAITTEYDMPSLIIYNMNVNDEPVKSDSAVWTRKKYTLQYNQNKISLSLTAFGLHPAINYSYEYKMEGYDKYWTATNNPINIAYSLPPGKYLFTARLKDMPLTTASATIIITYPFWQQWWFFLLAFSLFFFILLISFRTTYKKRYKVKLQALQVQQQILTERERISRDLHDNIGAYASAISANVDEITYQLDDTYNVTLQTLKESAREIIVQLRDSIWALNKESQTVIMLSDRIKNYVQKLQPSYPHIVFDVHEKITGTGTLSSIKALHILRIVQEAIQNAIKHSRCNLVSITLVSNGTISINIEDDGCGIAADAVNGEGLKNMKSRATEIEWQLAIGNKPAGCSVLLTGYP